ncbi:hypothetical protein DFP72DRAFT_909093 [Ephemerocybe angulata]|uniref:Uncharacterized protein n=1 Tax=Ephemerocybe angulata TaxID=980116 RepID=A0A8H6HQS3_9AGAR|nr:hypothetical protein DFP72DRAFT_909093 [Tulosesus angulatus]
MLTHLHVLSLHCIALILWLYACTVSAQTQRNVTLDDGDTTIRYQPGGAWFRSANNSLDFGFAHMLSQTPNATATLNFTGVAIYFLSPLWPYTVNTQISLDGFPPTLVDLVDHSRPATEGFGPETAQYGVRWKAEGLENKIHSLVMTMGSGQRFAIVDGLIYTVLDPAEGTPGSSSSLPTPTTTGTTPGPTPPSSPLKPVKMPIAVGAALGIFGFLLISLFIWFWVRKRHSGRRPVSEAWTITRKSQAVAPVYMHGPERKGTDSSGRTGTTGPSPISLGPPATYPGPGGFGGMGEHPYSSMYASPLTEEEAWQNPRYGYVGMPAPVVQPGSSSSAPPGQHSVYEDTDRNVAEFGAGGLLFPIPPSGAASSSTSSLAMTMSPGRYTPGLALSTITEASSAKSLSVRDSPASPASSGLDNGANGYFGSVADRNFAGEGERRHELTRARPGIRAGSLLARDVGMQSPFEDVEEREGNRY